MCYPPTHGAVLLEALQAPERIDDLWKQAWILMWAAVGYAAAYNGCGGRND